MEMTSASRMRSDLPTRTAPASLSLLCGQVWTPGDDLHIERERIAGKARPEAAGANDTEGFPGEADAHRHAKLETARAHGPIGRGKRASGGDHQAKREFSGRVEGLAARRVADRHALTRASLDVHRGI